MDQGDFQANRDNVSSSGKLHEHSASVAIEGRQTWFDVIPHELCQRIARHAWGHRSVRLNPFSLRLAQTSEKLRRAVLTVLEYEFTTSDVPIFSDTHQSQWIEVFRDEAIRQSYESVESPYWMLPWSKYPTSLVTASRLRSVHISDHHEHLMAIACSPSTREVTITIHGYSSARDVFRALENLPVEKLCTICVREKDTFACPYSDPGAFGRESHDLIKCCPKLTALDIHCSCPEEFCETNKFIWFALPHLSCLRELSLYSPEVSDIPKNIFPRISKLESVSLTTFPDEPYVVPQFGAAVTSFNSGADLELSTKRIIALHNHPRLRELKCLISRDGEFALFETIKRLPQLRKLDISWLPVSSGRELNQGLVSRDLFLSTMEATTNLSGLGLYGVQISMGDWEQVLKLFGGGLKEFGLCSGAGHDEPLRRVCGLLCMLVKYNSDLERLEIRHRGGGLTGADVQEGREEMVAQALAAGRLLEKRSPMLCHNVPQVVSALFGN